MSKDAEVKGNIGSALSDPDLLSPSFHLGIMKNIERNMPKRKRNITPNWKMVKDYLLGNTIRGGSTSCYQHCLWMGVDPDGFTFYPVNTHDRQGIRFQED